MKTILTIILLAFATLSAHAQNFGHSYQYVLLNGGTNKAVALSTNGYLQIAVPKSQGVEIFIDYKYLNAPGAGDATSLSIPFYRGLEGGYFESNVWFTWVPAGNSTTAHSTATNITVGGVSLLRCKLLNYGTNAHATNITFKYGYKN